MMRMILRFQRKIVLPGAAGAAIAGIAALALGGCTVYPEKKQPALVQTMDGQVIPRAQVVPWLKSLGIHGVQVSDMKLTPAVNDMNLVYTVQIQAEKVVSAQVGTSGAGKPQTLSALAVWQQPQPTGDDAKDKQARSKAYAGYLLTVHDLTTAVAEMQAQAVRPHGGCS
jgi:hypothetical protein